LSGTLFFFNLGSAYLSMGPDVLVFLVSSGSGFSRPSTFNVDPAVHIPTYKLRALTSDDPVRYVLKYIGIINNNNVFKIYRLYDLRGTII